MVSRVALLRAATRDTMHQPYRALSCPLLPRLLPLAEEDDVLSVTLSGAGSGVLLLLKRKQAAARLTGLVRSAADGIALMEVLPCGLAMSGAELGPEV